MLITLEEGYIVSIMNCIYLHQSLVFFLTNPDDKQVWAVLKPGFLALVAHPLDTKLLDIVVFDVLPSLEEKEESQAYLASHIKERNPLRYSFKV